MTDAPHAAAKVSSVGAAPYYTMIFDQSAHLDWDWIYSFEQNYWYYKYGQGVQAILDQAIKNLQTFNSPTDAPYYYTICEMGFFQRYIQENPNQITAIQNAGNNFQVISGGITSPDCLVCSGEGFVRNYLVGHLWLSQVLPFLQAKPHCWIPDDFGQGPELPALLAALGFVSVGFSRLPGTLSTCIRTNPQQEMLQNGVDFIWQASDGSQVIAHWMPVSYAFGNQLNNGPAAINNFTAAYVPNNATPPQYSAAKTPNMYIPIDDDFSMPVPGVLNDVQQWNDNLLQQGADNSNVAVVDGTFDQFIGKLNSEIGALRVLAPYNGTPYWTGYYASRAALKILHYETVRALTAAEVFALLTQPSNASLNNMLSATFWNDMAAAWADFAPSTHHDYVCGTATDSIYATEQLPLLQAAAGAARGLRAAALNALAGMVPSSGGGGWLSILVANPLGFPRSGLAEIANVVLPNVQSVSLNGSSTPVQRSFEGGMLFMASVPSMGYVSGNLSTNPASSSGAATSITPPSTGSNDYVLANDLLSATISQAANWGIASLNDTHNGDFNVFAAGATGNDLVLYNDGGDIYQFGNEYVNADQTTFKPDTNATFATSGPGLGAVVLEAGPLRVRLRTTVLVTPSSGEARYCTREYLLVAGEPFLRMTTTAQAPLGYSVMARFPLAAKTAAITHGTAYHWTSVQPLAGYWGPPTFQATHDFLIPQDANDITLAAAYHAAMPAWAYDNDGALIGSLVRNTPNGPHGAGGTDTAPHTQHYALRVPTGLGPATSGQPLKEALAFNTPLQAVEIPPGNTFYQFTGMLPGSGNLAGVNDGPAILTVAKPGSFTPTNLIFRLYQPTNQTNQTVQVQLGSNITPASASLVPAVERPWTGTPTPIQTTANGFTLTMNAAVATVQVTPSS